MFKFILYSFLVVQRAQALAVHYADSSCDGRKALIEEEMQLAMDMALAASEDVEKGDYYKSMFANTLRGQPNFKDETSQSFTKIASMASGTNPDYVFVVTCQQTSRFCGKGYYAHMGDDRKTMNFCDIFFTDGKIKGTNDREKDCQTMDLKAAHHSKAAILVHEMTHTRFAMLYEDPALDYAYGFSASYQLALGVFDRSCVPYKGDKALCPNSNGEEGVCDKEFSGKNADSYALVAAGIYYTNKCKRAIPLPPLPAPVFIFDPNSEASTLPNKALATGEDAIASSLPISILRRHRRSDERKALAARYECPLYDDYIVFDGNGEEIVGYVHFGDSYGAGMGTGSTSGDACRVGENNFGELLYKSWGDNSISFETKVCSGDTTKGLNRQIEEWKDPAKANVGTVSIGGNDVGFIDLVRYCILTPNTAPTRTGADFKLYVTNYAAFFNFDTTDCDKSTFHYWWAGYNPSSDWPLNRIVYLKQDLRVEMDGLVMDLNKVIEAAISDANAAHGGDQIYFVDVNPRFNGHRWCEQGDWHEPAPGVDSTWFFLSGWPDVSIEGSKANTAAVESAEITSLISAGRIPVPDANCRATLDSDADPYVRAMCHVAEAISEDPEGPEATYPAEANVDIKSGNITSQHIGWFTPTRQIKTFHPRSPGMIAYRDAVIESIGKAGQI
ncbi:Nn.00g089700.m01.CDS01 [Neocucurbitaria sp. VM-36]